MDVVADEPARSVDRPVAGLPAEGHRERVHVGYDQVAAGPHGAREFADGRAEVGAVRERERADREVDRVVGERQHGQVAGLEPPRRDLRPGQFQHRGRCVDADHPVAEGCQVFGVPAGAAGRVERVADRVARHDPVDRGLLGEHHRVARGVVDRGPLGVAVRDRLLAHDDGTRPRLLVEAARHLDDAAHPRLDSLRVQRPRAHDAEALEAEYEIAECRVLSHS